MSKIVQSTIGFFNPITSIVYEKTTQCDIDKKIEKNVTGKTGPLLKSLGIKKPVIVTEKILLDLELLNPMMESLEKEGIDYHIYDGVIPDPTFQLCEECARIAYNKQCDAVIAFGGGSSIDAGKLIAGLTKNPNLIGKPNRYMGMKNFLRFKRSQGNLPIIAIPTTAGTGAEVTMGAVISDGNTHKKDIVLDSGFVSRHVLLDPQLTVSLPEDMTAMTGLDALSHAVESYISGVATDYSKAYSVEAMKDLFKHLPQAVADGDDLDAREKVLNASYVAGLAIGRGHIGSVHAIGHNVGGTYGIAHGLCMSVILPKVTDANIEKSKKCRQYYAELATALGLCTPEMSIKEKALTFSNELKRFVKLLGLPSTLDLDKSKFDKVAKAAVAEAYQYPIPRYIGQKEILSILDSISR